MATTSPAVSDLLPSRGDVLLDKYEVLRALGSGGMGSVLEARHVTLGHKVALKILHQSPGADDEGSARFFREARILARLHSEHVVRIFDIGTTEHGLPFLVMERLVGYDLGQLLQERGPCRPSLTVEIMVQATRGLVEAHQAGIVHRDLKPSNLFLTRNTEGAPRIKILDFGISKVASEEEEVRLTQTRTVVGSPLYMSPEQVRDARNVDARTDIWSLGAILYELLSGKPAFHGDTLPAVYASIVTDTPDPVPEASTLLWNIAVRCLEKDRERRYPDAAALLAELSAVAWDLSVESLQTLESVFAAREQAEEPISLKRPPRSQSGEQSIPGRRSAAPQPAPEGSAARQPVPEGTASRRVAASYLPTLSSSDTASRRRPSWHVWLGALLLLALGVGGALWFGPRLVRSLGTTGSLSAPSRSATYHLDLATRPPGALVLDHGRVLGTTPLRLPFSESEREVRELMLEAEGHLPHTVRLQPLTADRTLTVSLVPEPKTLVETPTATAPTPAAPTPSSPMQGPPLAASPATTPKPSTPKRTGPLPGGPPPGAPPSNVTPIAPSPSSQSQSPPDIHWSR